MSKNKNTEQDKMKIKEWVAFFLEWYINLCGILINKNPSCRRTDGEGIKRFNYFSKGFSPKENVIEWLEFELANF